MQIQAYKIVQYKKLDNTLSFLKSCIKVQIQGLRSHTT